VENLEDAIAFLLNDQVQPSPPSSPGVSQVFFFSTSIR
jgi:hypothetical protein